MSLNIITKKFNNSDESSFYYGMQIATIENNSGTKFTLESRGELEFFDEDDNLYKGINAMVWLRENADDERIDKLYEDDKFRCCNWFAIIEIDSNGEVVGDDIALSGSYSDAIDDLISVSKE